MVRAWKTVEEMPGSWGLPLVGEALEQFRTDQLFFLRRFHRYGSTFRTKLMWMKIACLVGPQANQLVLKDQADKFSSRLGWSFLEPIFGQGILLQDAREHSRTKKLMYPAFQASAVGNYFEIIQDTVEAFSPEFLGGRPIPILDKFRQLALLIVYRIILGRQAEPKILQLTHWFFQLVEGIETVVRLDTPLTTYGRAMRSRRYLEEYLRSVIVHRRQDNSAREQDVLGLLMTTTDEEGDCLSDAEIVLQVLQLLIGGHETTAKLLCWGLFELAGHPEWLKRLRQEQEEVIGEAPLSLSHLKKLTLLANVVKELERLYPSTYAIPRGVIEEVEYAGYRIPKGWLVLLSPLLTHRLPEYYGDPDCFDPDRFAPPREEHKKHPFALIGFGGGAHKCLGYELAQMEMKIILATLIRDYDWQVTPDYASVSPVYHADKIGRAIKIQFEKL